MNTVVDQKLSSGDDIISVTFGQEVWRLPVK